MTYDHFYLDGTNTRHLDVKLHYTGIVADNPLWFNIPHQHSFCEILYVAQGSGLVTIADTQYTVHAGDLLLMNPGVLHEEQSDPEKPIYLAFLGIENFTLEGREKNHIIDPGRCPVISLGSYRSRIEQPFLELIQETSSKIKFYELISNNLVTTIMLQIERVLLSDDGSFTQNLSAECRKIKEFIDGNYTTNVTLDELAKKVYISKYHASHIFKSETGISPIRYVIEKRIEAAKVMLTDPNKTITEVAIAVGYDDPVYFSQIFKKATGAAPSRYRALLLK